MHNNLAESPTILVVDDCQDLAQWLCHDLERQGYDTDFALSGIQCLAKVTRTCYQFIILDVMMPGETVFTDFLAAHPLYLKSKLPRDIRSLYIKENGRHVNFNNIMSGQNNFTGLKENHDGHYFTLETLHSLCNNEKFFAQFGDVFIHFDGFTVCQLIKSLTRFHPWPYVLIFTAGGGLRLEQEKRAHRVGATAYYLKSEYNPGLLNKLRELNQSERKFFQD
ncbi:response regulator transcription factor [candidate division CSSED10-310 bacterium]|uniref:Response regulator transcription factor n=1 Tax=candidate division CSSED10-310 bacterium TaxID=2855610 RepID=A0ABV6YZU4_UNCC1